MGPMKLALDAWDAPPLWGANWEHFHLMASKRPNRKLVNSMGKLWIWNIICGLFLLQSEFEVNKNVHPTSSWGRLMCDTGQHLSKHTENLHFSIRELYFRKVDLKIWSVWMQECRT